METKHIEDALVTLFADQHINTDKIYMLTRQIFIILHSNKIPASSAFAITQRVEKRLKELKGGKILWHQ